MSKDKEADSLVDITSFNAVAQCEAGHEFEVTHLDGAGTGLFLKVQGRHSREVSAWQSKLLRQQTIEAQQAARRGKSPEPKSLDQLEDMNRDGAAVRVIGWRGAKQSFDRDLLKVALKNNPHWISQIVSESDADANFSKAQQTT